MILLTSLNRLFTYTELIDDQDTSNVQLLTMFMYAVSEEIQSFLSRDLELISRTEYFDIDVYGKRIFTVNAAPITLIESVHLDTFGRFDGGESEITNCIISSSGNSVVLPYDVEPGHRALRVVYTGGLAAHGTNSSFTLNEISGQQPIAGNYITGVNSGAKGRVRSYNLVSKLLVMEVIYGVFELGEPLTLSITLKGNPIESFSTSIAAIVSRALCEVAPVISMAAEMQIRYLHKHKDDFEDSSISKEGSNYWQVNSNKTYNRFFLRPEVRSMLKRWKRTFL